MLVPELSLGFASGSLPNGSNDSQFGGFLLNVGMRAGAEVHFGFIGIPELSLQASVGLGLGFQSTSSDICESQSSCNNSTQTSNSVLSLSTSVGSRPWDIFLGNISAIYYWE